VSRDEEREVVESKENIPSHTIRILKSSVAVKSMDEWSGNHYWYIMVAIIAQMFCNIATKEVVTLV